MNISRQMLFIMVLLVWHYTTTCTGVGKTVAGEGRTGLGHPLSAESVDSEYWCLKNAFVYAFIMRLTVEERVLRSTFTLNTLYKQDLEAPPSKQRIHSFIHSFI